MVLQAVQNSPPGKSTGKPEESDQTGMWMLLGCAVFLLFYLSSPPPGVGPIIRGGGDLFPDWWVRCECGERQQKGGLRAGGCGLYE